jgi:hypothetical protein
VCEASGETRESISSTHALRAALVGLS